MRSTSLVSLALCALATVCLPAVASAQAEGDPADGEAGLCAGPGLDLAPIAEVGADRTLRVTRFEPDDDGTTYVQRATVYTCDSCSNGTCYPTWNGSAADCTSATCSSCTLMADGDPVDRIADPGDGGCGEPVDDQTRALIDARLAAIDDYTQALELPQATYDAAGQEASAPEGFRLVVEDIGGVSLAYVVPVDDPGPGGAALRLYTSKAKCDCSGTGSCKFSGIVCSGSNCRDGCQITVKGNSNL